MKLAISVALFCAVAAIGTASPLAVDWSRVEPRHVLVEPADLPPMRLDLGVPQGRITNGTLATAKELPYQVGLLLYMSGRNSWCGGTLISNRWIVTAAHCTDSLSTGLDVYLGTRDRLDKTEEGQQIIFVPKRYVTVHPAYDPNTIANDISLIKLPVTIGFNGYVQPAKLPKMADSAATYVGEMAIASGWGRISDEATTVTDKLRWIEVPVLANSACSSYYYGGSVQPSNICIQAAEGKSVCNGDSGGPLVVRQNGENVVIGATSFGSMTGCEWGYPGVFTRISSYLEWIAELTGGIED